MRVALAFVFLAPCLANAAGDVVELRNGDRLSGTIARMTDDKLVITTPYAKEIPVSWAEVVGLESSEPHVVRLKPDDFVTARFTRRPDGVYLEGADLQSARPVALDQIATIDVSPGAHWSGAVTALLAGSKGNTERASFGGSVEAIRRTDGDRLRLGGRTEYAREKDPDTGTKNLTARNTRGWADYEYFLDEHWGIGGFGRLEYDHFQDLNLRTTVGAGPGYRFFDTKTKFLRAYLGLAYVNEDFREPLEDRDFITLALGDEFHWNVTETLAVYQLLDVYPSLDDTSDVLLHSAAGVRQAIAAGLFVDLGLEDDYDTVPADGRKKNDFRYRVQLGYGF
jgi:putative salt-induced outer membrane protein YdiY